MSLISTQWVYEKNWLLSFARSTYHLGTNLFKQHCRNSIMHITSFKLTNTITQVLMCKKKHIKPRFIRSPKPKSPQMVAYRRKWWRHRCNQSVRAAYRQRGGVWRRKESRFSPGPLVSMHVIHGPSQINWSIHINAVYLQSINLSWVKFGWCNGAAFSPARKRPCPKNETFLSAV